MKPQDSAVFSSRAICLIFLIFFAITWTLHSSGFHEPMVYDSQELILNKAHVFARHDVLGVMSIVSSRPLFMLSLYVNYLWAGMDPFWLRAVNVMLLALTGAVLVQLIAAVLQTPGLRVDGTGRESRAVAVFLGLWFVVHPLQTYVVLYIVQREAIMACLFYYAALWTYLAVRSGRCSQAGYVATGVLFLLGMLSKENVVTLPGVLLLAEITLFRQNTRQTVSRAPLIALITLPIVLIYFVVTRSLHGTESVIPPSDLGRLYEYLRGSGHTLAQVALTECRVFFDYLFMVLAPPLQGVRFFSVQEISTSIWSPPSTMAAAAGVLAIVVIAIGVARKMPILSFGALFFVAALLPESLLIPVYLFFGYRAILPMAGILFILGWILLQGQQRYARCLSQGWGRTLVAVLLAAPILCLACMTFSQSVRWGRLSFWQDGFRQLPPFSERIEREPYGDIITGMGGALVAEGRYEEAIKVLRTIENADRRAEGAPEASKPAEPRKALPYIGLGLALRKSGRVGEAIACYHRALEFDPGSAFAYSNLGHALEELGDIPAATSQYEKALELAPNQPEFHFNIGCILLKQGHWRPAEMSFRRALALNPNFDQAHANLGVVLLTEGKAGEAIPHLERALAGLENNAELHNAMGVALAQAGRSEEAILSFRRAIAIQADHEGARQNLESITNGIRRP
jgi:protein O-mannosyl-transferase